MTVDTEKPWVLIVEDDTDNRELLAEFLQDSGYDALTCGTAAEAEPILDAHPVPCLAITDVHMPDMDGRIFAARLRARPGCAQVPVVFVTGVDASTLGPVHEPVLTKPVDLEALMAMVNRHCGTSASSASCS